MIPITKAQISKIHVLLSQMNIIELKKDLVSQFSNGRVTSTKDMEINEARALLNYLSQYDPLDGMRRKVFSLAYDAGIIYGDSPEDKRMNSAKLNMFLTQRGAVKKELNKMDKAELVKTVGQFQQIVKHNEFTKTGKVTKNLLDELNIPTSKTKPSNQL